MRKVIKASKDLKHYTVRVNFANYVGADQDYYVSGENEDDACHAALEEANRDLTMEYVEDSGDGEYDVSVGFAGFVGVEEIYSVTADDEDDAVEQAMNEAFYDLSAEVVSEEDDV